MEFSQEFGGVRGLEHGLWKLLDTVVVIALSFLYIENATPVQGILSPRFLRASSAGCSLLGRALRPS